MTLLHRAVGRCAVALAASAVVVASPQVGLDLQRTVYISATSASGHVDLEPTELTVKEGGRVRQVLRVEKSAERLRVAIVLDELLAPDGILRQAVIQFVQQLRGAGDLSLYLVGQRTQMRVNYTAELNPFVSALNALPARAPYPGNLVTSVMQVAREQRSYEGRRAIVVVAPEIPELSTIRAEGVFDAVRDGAIVLHAATFVGWRTSSGTLQEVPATRLEGGDLTALVERDRMLGDGPKRSGGLRVASMKSEGFAAAFDRIADDLLRELRVTYLLAAGTKSDGRLSVETTRKGVTVRAPNRVLEP